jgi:hypothetical protein
VTGQSDRYQSLASLSFENDYPTSATSHALDNELFFQRAVQAYLWSLPAGNMYAMKEGQAKTFGEGYEVFVVFEKRLKANTLITTPNSDVIYGIGFLDLGVDGPMVVEAPPMMQALMDDFWHRPLTGPNIDGVQYLGDIGIPGPDKGEGGKYLVVPWDYDQPVGDEYFVYRSKTNGVFVFVRSFFQDPSDLQPAVDLMEAIRIYPLHGEARPMNFKHASDIDSYYLFANDSTYFDMLNRFVQNDVIDDSDPYMHGNLAAIGIAKGRAFDPSEEQRALLDNAAKTAWRMAKNIAANSEREQDGIWYADRQWVAHAKTDLDDFFKGTLVDESFLDRRSRITDVNARMHMFINHYSTSSAMISARVGLGAKYMGAYKDNEGNYLVGDNTYEVTLPPKVPAKLFWSLTAYDATTASGLANGQTYPSIGSRDLPEQNPDGSTTLYFGPSAPEGKEGNWLRTVPGKGWFCLLRLYGPEQSFFDGTWKPSDFIKSI